MNLYNKIKSKVNFNIFKNPYMVLGTYFLVIVLFAFLYWYFNICFSKGGKPSLLGFFDSLYFSVVTITTLGYGDISPTDGLGKILTGTEAISGIFLLGLYLNALSHNLAISYQNALKEKESLQAIKHICTDNWNDIGAYYWNLQYFNERFKKINFLKQKVSDSTPLQIAQFKDSVKEFNQIANTMTLKKLEEDKAKSVKHLNKFYERIDTIKYKKLLSHISVVDSTKLHSIEKNIIDSIKETLDSIEDDNMNLEVLSNLLYNIYEWMTKEEFIMKYIHDEIYSIIKYKR